MKDRIMLIVTAVIIILILLLCFVLIGRNKSQSVEQVGTFSLEEYSRELDVFADERNVGAVTDMETAKEKANELFREEFDETYPSRELKVYYDSENACWLVKNKPPRPVLGGVHFAFICKDGQVLAVGFYD